MSSVSSQLLNSLGDLRLRTAAVMEQLLTGEERGFRHGHGGEFAELRDYTPGDDLRRVDWKIAARRDRYYVRRYEQEARLQVICLIDTSPSMRFRSTAAPLSKLEYAAVCGSALCWLAARQGATVGWGKLGADQQPLRLLEGSQLVLEAIFPEMFELLGEQHPVPPAAAPPDLFRNLPPLTGRSVLIVLTDALGDLPPLDRWLQQAQQRQHDVRLLQLLDPAELEFPFDSTLQFIGLEAEPALEISSPQIRTAYLDELTKFQRELEHICRTRGVAYQVTSTSTPIEQGLRDFLTRHSSPRGRQASSQSEA
jgi:uncharacterized protein (DUF58 family)